MTGAILLIVLVGLTWFVAMEAWRGSVFRLRFDHQRLWLGAVPEADRARLETLLGAICEAFLIPAKYRFRLRPSDRLEELYRRNMRGQLGDSLEFEHLAMQLEDLGLDSWRLFSQPSCTVGSLVRSLTTPHGGTKKAGARDHRP